MKAPIFLMLFFGIIILSGFVLADYLPFTQCVQVYHSTNGSLYSNLNCTIRNDLGVVQNMSVQSLGVYCINITSGGLGSHTSFVSCSNGLSQQTFPFSYTIDTVSSNGPVTFPTNPQEVKQQIQEGISMSSPLIDILKAKPLVVVTAILFFVSLSVLISGRKK